MKNVIFKVKPAYAVATFNATFGTIVLLFVLSSDHTGSNHCQRSFAGEDSMLLSFSEAWIQPKIRSSSVVLLYFYICSITGPKSGPKMCRKVAQKRVEKWPKNV